MVEIWLTSEDLGAYGRDIGVTLPELLWQLVDVIPEGCMLRLGMTNPPYIMEHMKDIAAILSHPRVYSFLHVPVQCGSDAVLGDMRREYTIADFRHLVDYLKSKLAHVWSCLHICVCVFEYVACFVVVLCVYWGDIFLDRIHHSLRGLLTCAL